LTIKDINEIVVTEDIQREFAVEQWNLFEAMREKNMKEGLWKGGSEPDDIIKVRFNFGNRYEFAKHLADRKDICNRWTVFLEVTDLSSNASSKFIESVDFYIKRPGNNKKDQMITKTSKEGTRFEYAS
jgi:hypothetical protein